MTTAVGDTTAFAWRIEQGEREELVIPVLDDADSLFFITGWTVDAKVKTRPGGSVLYTWPAELAQITNGGAFITLTIPGPVSALWTWAAGWYRVKVQDPLSEPDDPTVQRILAGPFVVDAD